MVSKDAKMVCALLDDVDVALDRVAALPLHELTLDDRLRLWAQLEMLRLALAKAAHRARRAAS